MQKRKKKIKIGSPTSSVIYHGVERQEKTKISLIEYNENTFTEKVFFDVNECLSCVNNQLVKWINVDGVHQAEIIEAIGKHFNIHSLTLEDIANTNQRAKFEDYDNYVVAIMKMLYYDTALTAEQLSIVLMDNVVISFQEPNGSDAFDVIRNRIRQKKGRITKMKADYLAYSLLDAVVDYYFLILEKIGDEIEEIEEKLIVNPTRETMQELHLMKRQMIYVRKAIWPMRELVSNMERSESKLISAEIDIFLRDAHDHALRVIDTVETYRDLLSGMMDIYLSSVSNKMNEIMKVLTIITTIFVPVTFIAGVYGMNFDYMPELHSKWGYIITWAVMILIMGSLAVYFKKKKWL
jgi:magnesium transporter